MIKFKAKIRPLGDYSFGVLIPKGIAKRHFKIGEEYVFKVVKDE